jgi:hypothetical protein
MPDRVKAEDPRSNASRTERRRRRKVRKAAGGRDLAPVAVSAFALRFWGPEVGRKIGANALKLLISRKEKQA